MKPIGSRWRELRLEMCLDREPTAAGLDISPGHLKNIESSQPRAMVSERLALRAARFFGVPIRDLVHGATPDGVPDEPPTQPKPKPKPPKREEKAGKGPSRTAGRAA